MTCPTLSVRPDWRSNPAPGNVDACTEVVGVPGVGQPCNGGRPELDAAADCAYPDHTSGHLCGETCFFKRFSDPLNEITNARIWAGLHIRTADVNGRETGIDTAD
jgi:hypothetical protein